MSFYSTYQRLGVPVWASPLTLVRAAARVLTREARRDPAKRALRHAFYREMLAYQRKDQVTCVQFRL
jgi:hypothetical protein